MQFIMPDGPGRFLVHLDGGNATTAHAADARHQIGHPYPDAATAQVIDTLGVRPGSRPDDFIVACERAGYEVESQFNDGRSFIITTGA